MEKLGEGGMGAVYKVEHVRMGKIAALKLMRSDAAIDASLKERFLQESRTVAKLSHPNTVQVFDAGKLDDGSLFMAMEFLDGQPLQRIRTLRHKPEGTAAVELGIISQALLGLHYAHDLRDLDGSPLGVVHRDASPHNIFVTYDGFPADWYLRLTGEGAKLIRGERENQKSIPIQP